MSDEERVMPDALLQGTGSNRRIGNPAQRYADRDPEEGESLVAGFILPPFQRPPVWNREQQVALIESLWLGLPIAAYVVARPNLLEDTHVYGWLIDGQQRWRAIEAYQAGDFPVFGWRYPDLPANERRRFDNSSFPCVDLSIGDRNVLEDIYYRLAYGGVRHDLAEAPDSLPTPGKP